MRTARKVANDLGRALAKLAGAETDLLLPTDHRAAMARWHVRLAAENIKEATRLLNQMEKDAGAKEGT